MKLWLQTSSLRYAEETDGDCQYCCMIDSNMYEEASRQDLDDIIFNHGCKWPPMDYDCQEGKCICYYIYYKKCERNIDGCKKTLQNFRKNVCRLSKLNGYKYAWLH